MATAVVSGRVDEAVKHRADVVIRNAGETVASVINRVWEAMAETGELPESLRQGHAQETKREVFASFLSWLDELPEPNPAYADMTDDELFALKVDEHV